MQNARSAPLYFKTDRVFVDPLQSSVGFVKPTRPAAPATSQSNMHSLPWTVALTAALTLFGATVSLWAWQWGRPRKSVVLPAEWALTARPVFSADDRKVHRFLRETLPNHVVLSKLPLVRFCQPTDPSEVRYWFDLLGANHVTFAVCSTNGRVLVAIDLETDHEVSSRVMKIKQSVLTTCGVPYLYCAIDQLPSAAELQLLVVSASPEPRASQPAPAMPRESSHVRIRDKAFDASLPHPPAHAASWHESTVHWDSFFAPDSFIDTSIDSFSASKLSAAGTFAAELTARSCARSPAAPVRSVFVPDTPARSGNYDDIVIGAPRFASSTRL